MKLSYVVLFAALSFCPLLTMAQESQINTFFVGSVFGGDYVQGQGLGFRVEREDPLVGSEVRINYGVQVDWIEEGLVRKSTHELNIDPLDMALLMSMDAGVLLFEDRFEVGAYYAIFKREYFNSDQLDERVLEELEQNGYGIKSAFRITDHFQPELRIDLESGRKTFSIRLIDFGKTD